MVRMALLQHASQAILDDGREGMLAGLAERGWMKGKNLEVKLYNSEGDMPVAQAIAKEMVGGDYDILLTVSTPSLQAVANANRAVGKPHVFGLVANPAVTGVGISPDDPLDHPPHLVGYGTMQPVEQAFQLAREMNPSLASVGVVWNAAESNAEAQIKLAREVCKRMGIHLMEATVDNSAGVAEAAAALVARGAEALWVCGDVTVITAVDSVVSAARKGRIPVFTVIPPNVRRGALFDVGADYYEVGRLTGLLAGDILNGKNPAEVRIENVMPEFFALNLQALEGLKGAWSVPESLREKAQLFIDQAGDEHKSESSHGAVPVPNPSGKKWKIAVVVYMENPPAEQTLEGMEDGWEKSPLVSGKDYEITVRSAQGDIAALMGILEAVMTEGADIVVPLSTPSLQAAVQKIRDRPLVFTLVADPMSAGAGRSYEDHLPNVTGISIMAPAAEMLDLLEEHFPTYKRIGTLFCPSEVNSVDLKEALEELCRKRGFQLEAVAVNSPGELPDAAMSLAARPIDAIVQISDNLSSSGFAAISRAARHAKKPLLSLNSTAVSLGAPVALGRDYHDSGVATVKLIERIIAGENPGEIPFELSPRVICIVSPSHARAVGMTLPESLLKRADKIID